MTVADLLEDVQFTVDSSGQITAVVIQPALWQRIIELLEDSEDRALVQSLREQLNQHPAQTGALRWQDVEQEWE
jgi:hypothetical protein